MILTLTREIFRTDSVQGRLAVGDKTLFTIEQPWNDNIPFHSCIPFGSYTLEPHNSPHHPNTWAMVNEAIGIYHQKPAGAPATARDECLIHNANRASQLEGCMAPGLRRVLAEPPYIEDSEDAMDIVRKYLGVGTGGHVLVILDGRTP